MKESTDTAADLAVLLKKGLVPDKWLKKFELAAPGKLYEILPHHKLCRSEHRKRVVAYSIIVLFIISYVGMFFISGSFDHEAHNGYGPEAWKVSLLKFYSGAIFVAAALSFLFVAKYLAIFDPSKSESFISDLFWVSDTLGCSLPELFNMTDEMIKKKLNGFFYEFIISWRNPNNWKWVSRREDGDGYYANAYEYYDWEYTGGKHVPENLYRRYQFCVKLGLIDDIYTSQDFADPEPISPKPDARSFL